MAAPPDPVVWTDGDDLENIPNADDLNKEWKDSLNFFLGYTRPILWVYSTTGTSMPSNVTQYNVPFNNFFLNRDMGHSTVTNNDQITIPYTGQYQGFMWGAFSTLSAITGKCLIRLLKNGTQVVIAAMKPESTTAWSISSSLSVDCVAGDVLTMTMQLSTGTAVMGNSLLQCPRMLLYYAGDYS